MDFAKFLGRFDHLRGFSFFKGLKRKSLKQS